MTPNRRLRVLTPALAALLLTLAPSLAHARLGETYQQATNRLAGWKPTDSGPGTVAGSTKYVYSRSNHIYAFVVWNGKTVYELLSCSAGKLTVPEIKKFFDDNKMSGKWVLVDKRSPTAVVREPSLTGTTDWWWMANASAGAAEEFQFQMRIVRQETVPPPICGQSSSSIASVGTSKFLIESQGSSP